MTTREEPSTLKKLITATNELQGIEGMTYDTSRIHTNKRDYDETTLVGEIGSAKLFAVAKIIISRLDALH